MIRTRHPSKHLLPPRRRRPASRRRRPLGHPFMIASSISQMSVNTVHGCVSGLSSLSSREWRTRPRRYSRAVGRTGCLMKSSRSHGSGSVIRCLVWTLFEHGDGLGAHGVQCIVTYWDSETCLLYYYSDAHLLYRTSGVVFRAKCLGYRCEGWYPTLGGVGLGESR